MIRIMISYLALCTCCLEIDSVIKLIFNYCVLEAVGCRSAGCSQSSHLIGKTAVYDMMWSRYVNALISCATKPKAYEIAGGESRVEHFVGGDLLLQG